MIVLKIILISIALLFAVGAAFTKDYKTKYGLAQAESILLWIVILLTTLA